MKRRVANSKRILRVIAYVISGGLILLLLAGILVSVSIEQAFDFDEPIPTPEKIISTFHKHRKVFDELEQMLNQDRNSPARITVIGNDHIDEYWKEHSFIGRSRWSNGSPGSPEYMKSISEREMLERVGLSQERYEEYLKLLNKIGAYRISVGRHRYFEKKFTNTFIVHMARWGLSVSGGGFNIIKTDAKPEPLKIHLKENDRPDRYYWHLVDNWYLERFS